MIASLDYGAKNLKYEPTCSSVLRSPNSCMKLFSEGKRPGSRKCSRLKSSSTVFCRGVPVSRTLCSLKSRNEKNKIENNSPNYNSKLHNTLEQLSKWRIPSPGSWVWSLQVACSSCSSDDGPRRWSHIATRWHWARGSLPGSSQTWW